MVSFKLTTSKIALSSARPAGHSIPSVRVGGRQRSRLVVRAETKTVFGRVVDVVTEQLSLGPEQEVTEESTFINDLGADSLDIVEIVMALEEEFGMEMPEEDAEKILTIGDAADTISKLIEK